MIALASVPRCSMFALGDTIGLAWAAGEYWLPLGIGAVVLLIFVAGLRYIPHNYVGIVEKLWSPSGSVSDGRIIALEDQAGLQADVLRGGFHLGYWLWMYRIHRVPLVTIPQGKIGYVYARDGEPLPPTQKLARVVACANFQNARRFLSPESESGEVPLTGQRGRQRSILREGVYAINLALFVVITEDRVYVLRSLLGLGESEATLVKWQRELQETMGFSPVVVGQAMETADPLMSDHFLSVDSIGIATVHDGPPLMPGEIIAPAVGIDPADPNDHKNYQDPEAFLRAGGRRGRQLIPLTDGTYFINRWFCAVELIPKTLVPIGYVGVVVSYYGRAGKDLSGTAFRHGERVAEGERGVWEKPFGPGKYAFNTYAGNIVLVPTTNFVLHWITGKTETHRYDESLRSIDLVTRDAYEPLLPLSVVVHIDYQRAPNVIQRFGDVKKLITQTLDPMLSSYFRDIAHKKTMLELLQERDVIQQEARGELQRKFREFDIECVDVLIGKPDTEETHGKIETRLEQLRQRQLAFEQMETFERQRAASEKQRTLSEAQARAAMQTNLTNSQVQVQIAENNGQAEVMRVSKQAEAELARARRQAEQIVLMAQAELDRSRKQAEQTVITAEADSKQRVLAGRGEATRVMQVGLSEASVQLRKIASFGDPRLFALTQVAEHLSHSSVPLVPERLFVTGSNGDGTSTPTGQGMLGTLISLLVAEKSGFQPAEGPMLDSLRTFADRMTNDAMESMRGAMTVPDVEPAAVRSRTRSDVASGGT